MTSQGGVSFHGRGSEEILSILTQSKRVHIIIRWWVDDHHHAESESNENLSTENEGKWNREAGERKQLRS